MSDISIILSHYWCRHSTALCFIVLSCIFNFCQGQRGVHPACLKVRAPCHGNLRVRQRCLETLRPDSIRFVIIEGKTNEVIQWRFAIPPPSSSGFLAHDHIAIGRCAPTGCALARYDSEERTKSSEPSGRRSSCQAPGEAGDLVSTSAKGSCRNPPTPFPDNLGSKVPAQPRAVFTTDIQPAVPETSHPLLPHSSISRPLLLHHYFSGKVLVAGPA